MNERAKTVLVATLMRRHGETGVQTHANRYNAYLETLGPNVESSVVTPFDIGLAAYPLFAPRALLDCVSSSLGVGWYHFGHYLALKWVLRKRIAEPLRQERREVVVQAQCPWSARAAIEVKQSLEPSEQSRLVISMIVHFNRSQAEEWENRGRLRRGHPAYDLLVRTERFASCNADRLVFASKFMRDHLVHLYPSIGSTPSITVPYGVSASVNEEGAEPRWTGDLISIGTLEPRKNQAFLLEILNRCRQRGYDYRLTLIGDGEDRKRLERKAAELVVADLVTFAGYVPYAESQIPGHRAYVHSALIDNFPIVLLDALAAGVPLFAYPAGGVPEIFTDGTEGSYWNVKNAEEAAGKLIRVLEDQELYAEMASSSLERASQLSPEKVYAKMSHFEAGL